jgi:hypothetical protein
MSVGNEGAENVQGSDWRKKIGLLKFTRLSHWIWDRLLKVGL